MYTAKKNSTQQLNRQAAVYQCPVTFTLDQIGGRWKALILYQLINGPLRYSGIKKAVPAVTEKMLVQKLKELEADKLIIRKAKAVVPPVVTYRLSKKGLALRSTMEAMANWGFLFMNRK